jgi:decaprenylphospho-beta-D-erythro-pentofuranosid-2-ulose 2-reductase
VTPDRVLIIGATSVIAHAVARRYAPGAARFYLLARRADLLADNADDLRVRGASEVRVHPFEAGDFDSHPALIDAAFAAYDGFDKVLVAHGVLPDQGQCEASVQAALASFDINARSMVSLLTLLAERMQRQGSGVIGVISSVAGDRGRASNYVYGAAKAAVSAFAAGLRHRLHASNVRVVTILPGIVDTPMTAGLKRGALWAKPETVAADIAKALDKGSGVTYTPGIWRFIMAVIRVVPEAIFVRTKL